jgi:hypothetical protein
LLPTATLLSKEGVARSAGVVTRRPPAEFRPVRAGLLQVDTALDPSVLRAAIARDHRVAEADIVRRLRALRTGPLSAESFLRHYGLSTREGVALMCVAEALLRIPDAESAGE